MLIIEYIIWILYILGTFFVVFWLGVFFFAKHQEHEKKQWTEWPAVTIVIPAWNEEKTIEKTVRSAFELDYPSDKLHIVCVNDGSTDKTKDILTRLSEEFSTFKVIHQKNQGKYVAMNTALKNIDTPYFASLDADSYLAKNSLKESLKEFSDENVGAVLPTMHIVNAKTTLSKAQWLEFVLSMYFKSIFAKLDCIHVTPGPFSLYSTRIVKEIGCFRHGHLTEDLELAFRLQSKHYKIRISLSSMVYVNQPETFKSFVHQRARWYQGALLNLKDYKRMILSRSYGDFGMFYLPMAATAGILALIAAFCVFYLAARRFINFVDWLFLIDFDIMTYYETWNFSYSFLDINWQVLFSTFIGYVFIITIMSFAFLMVKHRTSFVDKSKIYVTIFYYFFVYKFMVAYAWGVVVYRLSNKKKNTWRSE